jgi:hypothetical protein
MNTITTTFHKAHNYGAVLQSYALQKTILSLNTNNKILNYSSVDNQIFSKVTLPLNRIMLVNIYNNICSLIFFNKLRRLHKRFDDFIYNDLILTKSYSSISELRDTPPLADCYITGSDQVWNVNMSENPAFFLEFGAGEIKRVSYAASMGNYTFSKEKEKKFINSINTFDMISVREEEAKMFIEEKTNKKCFVNIDPVFLLNKETWSELTSGKIINEKYILCYPLLYNDLLKDAIKKIKDLTGYKIVVLITDVRTKIKGDIIIRDAGPKEFLSLIKYAEYVFTTSFHGTAFSIIFEKKFFSFIGNHAPTRIVNILNKFDLKNKLILDIDNISLDDIDYLKVNKFKENECSKSINYLKCIFGEKNE